MNEPWLSVSWDGAYQCIYAEFKAFANSAEFRTSTLKILEAVRQRNAVSFVSDNRRLEGVANEDQLWLRDTWMPLAVAAGIRRIAVVIPNRGLGKIASEEIIGKFGTTVFATRTFTTVSEAMEWAVGAE